MILIIIELIDILKLFAGSKSYSLVSHEDQALIDTLLEGPIATAVQTTESFLFYSSGIV